MLLSVIASFGLMQTVAMSGQVEAITEYPVPTPGAVPHGIVRGPDAALWFAESATNKIGRLDATNYTFVEYPLPGTNHGPETMTVGPDGAIWFTEQNASSIGRITTNGVVNEFPTPTRNSGPHGLTVGPDGAIWFSERALVGPNGNGQIGRLDVTNGTIQEFPLPVGAGPEPDLLVAGPDGGVWFGERNGGKLGRIDPTNHAIVEFVPPTRATVADPTLVYTHGITVGPDHAIWFTEQRADKIGRFDLATQTFCEFPLPTPGNAPHFILVGPDKNLWFTEQGVTPNLANVPATGNKIGRITTAGEISEFPVPTAGSQPYGMTVGPDQALWFTEAAANKVGRLPVSVPTETATDPSSVGGSATSGSQTDSD